MPECRCNRAVLFIITAFLLAAGLGLLVASAVVDKTYWTFITLIPLCLFAVPLVFCKGSDDGFGEGSLIESLGHFVTGFLITCLIGTVMLMRLLEAITDANTALAFVAMAMLVACAIVGSHAVKAESY